jgi:hypothetical protein
MEANSLRLQNAGKRPGLLKRFFDGEWYVSWGYNAESWAPTDIHVKQPSLGNDFTIHNVRGHDEPPWEEDQLISADFTGPQYSVRVGRFLNKKKDLAVEFNYDHTKYTSTIGQRAHVTGTIDGKPVDQVMTLDENTFRYDLHNGANHVMVNIVKRLPLFGEPNKRFSLAGIAKAGVGVMLPHADNTIFGNKNDVGPKKAGNYFGKHTGWWQLDGWTAGLEAGVRFVPIRPIYLELTDKIAYARMSDVPVYKGTAEHDLWMNQIKLSLGVTINGRKRAGP